MDIYAFANQKGGVGKTTVTLGVAAALARRGARVLLVDLDPQASATKVLGVDLDDQVTIADAMLEPERFRLTQAIVDSAWGFDVAPAETALASRESRRAAADEFVLRDQLAQVQGYDVVLIDCPPSLGVLTLNALAAATRLVVVTEPSFLALQGIDELLETRDLVCAHYNERLALVGVIVNRVEHTVEHRAGCAEIASYFGPELVCRRVCPSARSFRSRPVAASRSSSCPRERHECLRSRSKSSRPASRSSAVSSAEPRSGLGARRGKRPHPAAPTEPRAARRSVTTEPGHDDLVMLCVRVTPDLRRRVKLVAAQSGRPIQALATEALERLCTQYDM